MTRKNDNLGKPQNKLFLVARPLRGGWGIIEYIHIFSIYNIHRISKIIQMDWDSFLSKRGKNHTIYLQIAQIQLLPRYNLG